MIEKIIIQDSREVQSVWIPERRSLASFAIWKAFGLGSLSRWQDGHIVAGAAVDSDRAAYPELPEFSDFDAIPPAVASVVARIDDLLPPAESCFPSLDPDSLTIPTFAPAFLMPEDPDPCDAATVAVAARLLHRMGMAAIIPTGMNASVMSSALDFISRAALAHGGPGAVEMALGTVASPSLWTITPPIEDEAIRFGETDDD